MVLAVMVCFLIFRVYQVVRPVGDGGLANNAPIPPASQVPESVDTPGLPPPQPPIDTGEDWSRLWRFPLFVYRQPRDVTAGPQNSGEQEINVELKLIREARPGQYLAQIQTASRTGWYSEGEAFEAFELLEIDPDAGCVVIYSEQLQQNRTLCLE